MSQDSFEPARHCTKTLLKIKYNVPTIIYSPHHYASTQLTRSVTCSRCHVTLQRPTSHSTVTHSWNKMEGKKTLEKPPALHHTKNRTVNGISTPNTMHKSNFRYSKSTVLQSEASVQVKPKYCLNPALYCSSLPLQGMQQLSRIPNPIPYVWSEHQDISAGSAQPENGSLWFWQKPWN